MAKSKPEIRFFLDSQVGHKVNQKAGKYNGQCVSLIKAVLEFIGAPDPYKSRGNAKDVANTLLREGIASNGKGYLNVCVNRTMGIIGGIAYGHVWISLDSGDNYEQNGAKALLTTKNTRPLSQARQIVNLDRYIITQKSNDEIAQEVIDGKWGNGEDRRNRLLAAGYNPSAIQAAVNAKLSKPNQPTKKSNDQIADEVIKGQWGNGEDRKNRLRQAGYDPAVIQAIINNKLK